jgi:hypothetical protein
MSNSDSVHVFLIHSESESNVLAFYENNMVVVNVYIRNTDSYDQHKSLLIPFANLVSGKQLLSFESDNIPSHIDNLFRFICRQLNNGVSLVNLVDEHGQLLTQTHAQPIIQPEVQHMVPPTNLQQTITNIANTIENNVIDQTQLYSLISNLGSALINITRNDASTPFINILNTVGRAVNSNRAATTVYPEARFVENRQGATRDIILTHSTEPINVSQVNDTSNVLLARLQYTPEDKKRNNIAVILQIVKIIKDKIALGKSKPPSFIKPKFKKIKNYIYHLTKIWLSKKELEIFISEMNNNTDIAQNNDILDRLD